MKERPQPNGVAVHSFFAMKDKPLTLDTLTRKIKTNTQNRKYFPDLPWNMCSPAIFFVYVSANFVASP